MIALGAGQRANPTLWDADGDDANNNHYYVIKDRDPLEKDPSTRPNVIEASPSIDTSWKAGSSAGKGRIRLPRT